MKYVALQVKTCYSMLESLNNITPLVSTAKKLGYKSLAITDNNMFGVINFYKECQNNDIKPIIGLSLNVDNSNILLYAINNDGYKNLIKLSTIMSERIVNIEDLITYKDNLILIMPYITYNEKIYNIYNIKYIGYSNKEEKNKIKDNKVFINNVSYLNKEDYKYLDYAKMIKLGKVLGEYELNNDKAMHLLSESEVLEISEEKDIANTYEIASLCNVEITYTKDLLPIYDKSIDAKEYLKELCTKGLSKRLNNKISDNYQERLNYELDIIDKMGFSNYFLIVWDYVKYAKKNGILVGPGRGSAAGSLVSYVLGITEIDPIKYDLLFERFLNPERVTMPDIDIDFDSDKRDEVIDYVINKYGNKKVAGIITFNTLGAKQVIRDVSRVLKINNMMVDNLTKLITENTLEENYNNNHRFKSLINSSDALKKLYNIAIHLEGLPRHVSIHAAGIVMSNKNIDEIIPLYKSDLGIYLTAYSMNYLEDLGLLKMDFLGIKNLTLIDQIIKNIKETEDINITFNNIPLDDKKTLKIFATADTDGIFQFESTGMKRFLKKLNPSSLDDLIAANALYRPGPMDNIDNYIRRKEGKETIDYLDKSLEEILKSTYGIIVYQEQIMQIASALASYTLGEADILRRAMSKKKESVLISEKDKFVEKSIKNGHSKELSEKVYDLILKFANYGFNKSHSVSYVIVAYKMAFLKTYFYKYFASSILNNVIGSEIKTKLYLLELKNKNVNILMPDINKSMETYQIEAGSIRLPLSIIKNIGVVTTKEILKERTSLPFIDFIDFIVRMNKKINKKIITNLILSGCFTFTGYNKKTLIENLDNIINYAELVGESSLIEIEKPIILDYIEYDTNELINMELETYGFYLSNHPVMNYKKINDLSTKDIPTYYNKNINIKLYIERINEIITKKNDVMAFIESSDEYGSISLTLFPDTYKIYNKIIKKYDVINIVGKVEKRFDKYQIIVSKIEVL